jgi:hypothetical protein
MPLLYPKSRKEKRKHAAIDSTIIPNASAQLYIVERIMKRRFNKKNNTDEVLVRWEGFGAEGDTWEPEKNLKNTFAYDELMKAENAQQIDRKSSSSTEFADTRDWSDEGQLNYRAVDRIHVNDPLAQEKVRNARESGTPVVIVGHKGWAQFARWWLKGTENDNENEPLDLSLPYELDLKKMADDIGNEMVPVLKKNYNPLAPIEEKITVEQYLNKYWKKKQTTFYLHQWMFPDSKTARSKMCGPGQCAPLPVLGEDLFALNGGDQWSGDSPLQYIFMGFKETMSKMHNDTGGFLITIAPIVGEKECIMLHRVDGDACFSHLEATLENVDLQKYPLMPFARLWKTTIKPGEILLMPHSTYHQCRNVTPCLSYSRMHADVLNLPAMLYSHLAKDAPELNHLDVIWNASVDLSDRLDEFVQKSKMKHTCVPRPIQETVDTLLFLKCISRYLSNRAAISDLEYVDKWDEMVTTISESLHFYRYRGIKNAPKFLIKSSTKSIAHHKGARGAATRSAELTELLDRPAAYSNKRSPRKSFPLHTGPKFKKLPPSHRFDVLNDDTKLETGNRVLARIQDRMQYGEILAIKVFQAVLLTYEELTCYEDDWQPVGRLRKLVSGELSAEMGEFSNIPCECRCELNENGECYAATVKQLRKGTFYSVRLDLDDRDPQSIRWFSREDIIEKEGIEDDDLSESPNVELQQRSYVDSAATGSLVEVSDDGKKSADRSILSLKEVLNVHESNAPLYVGVQPNYNDKNAIRDDVLDEERKPAPRPTVACNGNSDSGEVFSPLTGKIRLDAFETQEGDRNVDNVYTRNDGEDKAASLVDEPVGGEDKADSLVDETVDERKPAVRSALAMIEGNVEELNIQLQQPFPEDIAACLADEPVEERISTARSDVARRGDVFVEEFDLTLSDDICNVAAFTQVSDKERNCASSAAALSLDQAGVIPEIITIDDDEEEEEDIMCYSSNESDTQHLQARKRQRLSVGTNVSAVVIDLCASDLSDNLEDSFGLELTRNVCLPLGVERGFNFINVPSGLKVIDVANNSPVVGLVSPGDVIVAIDDFDVRDITQEFFEMVMMERRAERSIVLKIAAT